MEKALKQLTHDPDVLGLKSHTTKTRFGKLHYIAPTKRNSKEVMLFIHGFGANWTIWTPLIKSIQKVGLLKGTDFLLVDLPSFGKSENKLQHLKSEEIADELIGLCKKLGYSKIRITGHSMGGFLTLDTAYRYPEVKSVHVIAGTYFRVIRIANNPLKSIFTQPKLSVYYFIQTVISKSAKLTKLVNSIYRILLGKNRKPVYELGGSSFLYASRNGIGYDADKNWGSLKMPAHAAYASNDRMVSKSDMLEFKSILPKAKITTVQNAGHSLLITHPEKTAKALY